MLGYYCNSFKAYRIYKKKNIDRMVGFQMRRDFTETIDGSLVKFAKYVSCKSCTYNACAVKENGDSCKSSVSYLNCNALTSACS